MKQLLVLAYLYLASTLVHGQKVSFQYSKINIGSIDSLELSQNGRRWIYDYPIGLSEDYFPKRNDYKLSQPIVYRKHIRHFQYETSYYYSLPDSVLRVIEYWWEDTLYSKRYILKQVKKNEKAISKHFKNPMTLSPETDKQMAKSVWEDDSVYIEQHYTTEFLHRIRVIISWK